MNTMDAPAKKGPARPSATRLSRYPGVPEREHPMKLSRYPGLQRKVYRPRGPTKVDTSLADLAEGMRAYGARHGRALARNFGRPWPRTLRALARTKPPPHGMSHVTRYND